MFDLDKITEIFQTITRNRTRSFLTAFGVFWGVFMLVALIGGGNGLKRSLDSQLAGVSKNIGIAYTDITSEAYMGFRKGRYWDMRLSDIPILYEKVEGVKYLIPMGFGGSPASSYQEKTENFSVKGLYPQYVHIMAPLIVSGRYINDIDVLQKRKVCVIGERVRESLFSGGVDPIGKYIKTGSIYYQVVGVIRQQSKNMNMGGSDEESVILPFTTLQESNRMGDVMHMLCFSSKKGYSVAEVEEQIGLVMRQQHKISPTDHKAFQTMNVEKQFEIFNKLFLGVDILIWIVGLGTLFAAVIGVSNIMMVTVKERTQEIGIRRALGASPRQIISQIVFETIALVMLAGVFGMVFGVGVLSLITMMTAANDGPSFLISFSMAVATVFVILLFSLIASMAPAMRAMNIKAIDALRDE